MSEQTAKQWRPFHEVIVDLIREASTPEEVTLLGRLIKETEIPKGHYEILAAWNQHRDNWGLGFGYGVTESLLQQKQEAEKKKEEKKTTEGMEASTF